MDTSHKTIYDLLMDHLTPGERIDQVICFDTVARSIPVKGQYPSIRVPLEQPMRWNTAKTYLKDLHHDSYCPRIRIKTSFREIFISPSPIAQSLSHNGYLEPFTLAVAKELVAT